MPRGQGKSTLVAALGLYDLMLGEEGASVVVAATDERQAGIVFKTAARMVELNEDLSSRVQVFKDRLYVPERGASFVCLPAEPKRLEGLDYTTAILDEIGVDLPRRLRGRGARSGQAGDLDPDRHRHARPEPARLRAVRHAPVRRRAPRRPVVRVARVLRRRLHRSPRRLRRTAGSWRTRRWTTSCTATR